jgi:cold shock protein
LGWGVLDSIDTPGGCWVHFSHIDVAGYRSLTGVATVLLDYETARQDGYGAVRVRVPGRESAPMPTSERVTPTAAGWGSRSTTTRRCRSHAQGLTANPDFAVSTGRHDR